MPKCTPHSLVAEFKWDEPTDSMKTCPSISVGFGSGLLASNYEAFVSPSVDLQSWAFKCDGGDATGKRSRLTLLSVPFPCVPLAFCPGLFSFDTGLLSAAFCGALLLSCDRALSLLAAVLAWKEALCFPFFPKGSHP